eukprot:TRINITY_DN3168_c0_g1_i1.p1 TRINITY_DN3168_c0_g1~~TRINITY_DN3168_c0_g1_i1.p1  ORF type:complete len:270 (-),score=31.93 TRINITY_DN3168_c0_g1_i1:79-888(-)
MDPRSKALICNKVPTKLSCLMFMKSKVSSYELLGHTGMFAKSYILPDQLDEFNENKGESDVWMVKEDTIDCGKGIYIFTKDEPIPPYLNPRVLVQEYIQNPFLWEGRKFHYRALVLLTWEKELYAWHRYFFYPGRQPYQYQDFNNLSIHLTNRGGGDEPEFSLHDIMPADQYAIVQQKTNHIIRESIKPMIMSDKDQRGYSVIGYDFMIDADLGVWLLEMNGMPGNIFSGYNRFYDSFDILEEISQLMVDVPYLNGQRTSFNFVNITES